MPAYVFIPADLEPAKIDHALAYGATVVPIDGTYDDVNRLCLEVADETGWGFVNVNLRPFYAEGSKTLAFEIAEGTRLAVAGRDRRADRVRARCSRSSRRASTSWPTSGLIERRPIRFVGGQAAGCAPVATAWAEGTTEVRPVRTPDTFVRSLAIGNPADGRYSVELANASGGSIEAIPDEATAAAIRQVAALEGIFAETAGGVTVAAAEAARRRGVIRDGDEVVALLTGNGLKTPDARLLGLEQGGCRALDPPEPVGLRSLAGDRGHERGPHPADAAYRDLRGEARRGRRRRRSARSSTASSRRTRVSGRSCSTGRAASTASSTSSSTTPTCVTSTASTRPSASGTRSCCCRRWPAAVDGRLTGLRTEP